MYWIGYIGYHAVLKGYWLLLHIASYWNHKAKLLVDGQKDLLQHISANIKSDNRLKIWFHCASLGEFEQARPLIEKLNITHPTYAIVITFFSPSGYEIRKNYLGADYIFYLPADNKSNADTFVQLINPALVFFIKYEVWYYYLKALKQRQIPIFLISANIRENHVYVKWYGIFFKAMLQQFNHLFCQNEASAKLLLNHKFNNVSVSKDTRFDRVLENSMQPKNLPEIAAFKGTHKIVVAGSSYAAEEKMIAAGMLQLKQWKMIIAPHHINVSHIEEIKRCFAAYEWTTYSDLIKNPLLASKQVLIMDNIGLLSAVYQYADCAFIGGGYGKNGLHNTLEACVFGMPILFGPHNLTKFPESIDMVEAGVGFVIPNQPVFEQLLKTWNDNTQELEYIAQKAKEFIISQTGATQHVLNFLVQQQYLPVSTIDS
jgi:3-deoxy-D-manno-octulosonic-acid transferase